jgi:hypothetical protein
MRRGCGWYECVIGIWRVVDSKDVPGMHILETSEFGIRANEFVWREIWFTKWRGLERLGGEAVKAVKEGSDGRCRA